MSEKIATPKHSNHNTAEKSDKTPSLADLFASAKTITRGTTENMAEGWKCYADKIAIKHQDLADGQKVLVKITADAIVFIKSEKGNRTLTEKGTDGRVMLSMNEQMKKTMKKCFTAHKIDGKCETLKLETETATDEQGNKNTYYIMRANAEIVEE